MLMNNAFLGVPTFQGQDKNLHGGRIAWVVNVFIFGLRYITVNFQAAYPLT